MLSSSGQDQKNNSIILKYFISQFSGRFLWSTFSRGQIATTKSTTNVGGSQFHGIKLVKGLNYPGDQHF